MKFKEAHKKRVEKVTEFANQNKVFTIIAVIIAIYLLFSMVNNSIDRYNGKSPENHTSQAEMITEETETSETEEDNQLHFYWIDLWVLLGGGGFCVIMIIREKKKAREKV